MAEYQSCLYGSVKQQTYKLATLVTNGDILQKYIHKHDPDHYYVTTIIGMIHVPPQPPKNNGLMNNKASSYPKRKIINRGGGGGGNNYPTWQTSEKLAPSGL